MGTAEYSEWDLTAAMDQTAELGAWAGSKIAEAVAFHYGMTIQDLLSRNRSAVHVEARARLYERLHTEAGWGVARIGRFCKRDHTTIMYALGLTQRTLGKRVGSAHITKGRAKRLRGAATATKSGAREVA